MLRYTYSFCLVSCLFLAIKRGPEKVKTVRAEALKNSMSFPAGKRKRSAVQFVLSGEPYS